MAPASQTICKSVHTIPYSSVKSRTHNGRPCEPVGDGGLGEAVCLLEMRDEASFPLCCPYATLANPPKAIRSGCKLAVATVCWVFLGSLADRRPCRPSTLQCQ